jgi:hypothetical protein
MEFELPSVPKTTTSESAKNHPVSSENVDALNSRSDAKFFVIPWMAKQGLSVELMIEFYSW